MSETYDPLCRLPRPHGHHWNGPNFERECRAQCERAECEREAIYVAYTYGQRQKLCPFHAYAAPSRRPIYPKDRD